MCIRDLDKHNLAIELWFGARASQLQVMSKSPQRDASHFKNGQKWHKNNHLASFTKVQSKSLIHFVRQETFPYTSDRKREIDSACVFQWSNLHTNATFVYVEEEQLKKDNHIPTTRLNFITLVSLLAWFQFHQQFTCSFYAPRSQKRKKTVKSSSFLCFWDLWAWKLHVKTLMKLTPCVMVYWSSDDCPSTKNAFPLGLTSPPSSSTTC